MNHLMIDAKACLCCVSIVAFLSVGCSNRPAHLGESPQQTGKPVVYTVNYPLAYFAERIGGAAVEVVFPAPGDVDPKYWKPDSDAIAGFQSADLILLNGAGYAKWTAHATLRPFRMVNTTRDVMQQYIEVPDAITHSHGPGDVHSHAGLASETWLDPKLAIAQASVIRQEFEKLAPELKAKFDANFDALRTDLEKLESQLESFFASSNKTWIASHPVYDYLARRYSLDLRSLHWEPDEFPSDEQWQQFEKMLGERPSTLMLWENDPLEETSKRLESLGVKVVPFRPLANRPSSGDYLSLMNVVSGPAN